MVDLAAKKQAREARIQAKREAMGAEQGGVVSAEAEKEAESK